MKVLITGSTGLLGKAMIETCPAAGSVISLHLHPHRGPALAKDMLGDIRDRNVLTNIFEKQDFDVVVHMAGISNVDYAERHHQEALESNLGGTANIVECCNQFHKRLIYVSSNAVFDGTRAPYRETDPVSPIHVYGRIKVQCEELVEKSARRYSIARPILTYGWNHPTSRQNPLTWLLGRLAKGEVTPLVTDVCENPLASLQAGEALWRLVECPQVQLVHLAGAETMNRYEFGLAVAEIFGLDASLLQPVDREYFPELVPRPPNTSYVTERMEHDLGVKPLTLREGLRLLKQRRTQHDV